MMSFFSIDKAADGTYVENSGERAPPNWRPRVVPYSGSDVVREIVAMYIANVSLFSLPSSSALTPTLTARPLRRHHRPQQLQQLQQLQRPQLRLRHPQRHTRRHRSIRDPLPSLPGPDLRHPSYSRSSCELARKHPQPDCPACTICGKHRMSCESQRGWIGRQHSHPARSGAPTACHSFAATASASVAEFAGESIAATSTAFGTVEARTGWRVVGWIVATTCGIGYWIVVLPCDLRF